LDGQFHSPAALPLGERIPYTLDRKLGGSVRRKLPAGNQPLASKQTYTVLKYNTEWIKLGLGEIRLECNWVEWWAPANPAMTF
jgi:hypothetical protein